MHGLLYRASGGRIAASLGGAKVLVLQTTGRRSGGARRTPLFYVAHPEGFIVVASAHGSHQHPHWYRNLLASREATIEVGRDRVPVTAQVLGEADRASEWPRLVRAYPAYADYERATPRRIPLVLLRRAAR